jgi:hypothetical protein
METSKNRLNAALRHQSIDTGKNSIWIIDDSLMDIRIQ